MTLILPDLLEKDPHLFQQKLHQASSLVKRIHIDVIEPAFAPNPTILPEEWSLLDENIEVDVHLMVGNPSEWLDRVIVAGGTIILGHIEKIDSQKDFVQVVLAKGMKVGLAVDLPTDIKELDSQILDKISQVLLMAVKAGHAGQAFDPQVLEKITWLRQYCGENTEIVVDGGINLQTAQACIEAGATGLAANTWLWQDFENHLRKLQALG